MIVFAWIILLLAPYSRCDADIKSPDELKVELRQIEALLEIALIKNKSDHNLVQSMGAKMEEIKNRGEFHELMEMRSLRFHWQRVQYDLSTLRKRNSVSSRMNSTTPISFPLDETVNLLVRIYSVVPNILPEDFTYWPKHTKNMILGFVRAFLLLKKARELDDRPLHRYEQDLIKAVELVFKEGEDRMNGDPEAEKNLLPPTEPTNEILDAGFELFDGSSLFAEFISKLEEIERDVIKTMEGIVVVVQGNNCHIYSKVGKWYLATYPCNLW